MKDDYVFGNDGGTRDRNEAPVSRFAPGGDDRGDSRYAQGGSGYSDSRYTQEPGEQWTREQLTARGQDPKKKKKRKKSTVALVVVLSILAVLVLGVFIAFRYFYGRANYVDEVDRQTVPEGEEYTLNAEEEQAIRDIMGLNVPGLDKSAMKDIYNILLIGVDRRDRSWNGNSDAMILMTVNNNTGKIYMTSFLRDLYANIEGVGVRKLNNAYAVGGGPLLVQTLETNYGVVIDNYAAVDFFAMEDIINIFGGVEIEIKDYEIPGLQMFEVYDITAPGVYNLNGAQALAYTRIRYYGNADFERTSRQRLVLEQLIAKGRQMSTLEQASLMNQILPYTTHDLTSGDVLTLATDLPKMSSYEIVELRIPYDNEYHSQDELLIPNDINDTVTKLRNTIYAKE